MEWVVDKIDSINECEPTCGVSGHSDWYINLTSFLPVMLDSIHSACYFISTTDLAQLKNLAQTPFIQDNEVLVTDEPIELEK